MLERFRETDIYVMDVFLVACDNVITVTVTVTVNAVF